MNNIFAERLKKDNGTEEYEADRPCKKGGRTGRETWKESCEPVSEWKNNSQIRNS